MYEVGGFVKVLKPNKQYHSVGDIIQITSHIGESVGTLANNGVSVRYNASDVSSCVETGDDNRKGILLKAAYDILMKCKNSPYMLDPLSTTAHYDDTFCDGYCLMENIKDELGIEEDNE